MSLLLSDDRRPHTKDADCTVIDDVCVECGAGFGDPCPTCTGRAFHAATCDAPPRSEGAQGIEAGPMYRGVSRDERS